MVESDAGAGKRMLDDSGDLIGIPIDRDRDRTLIPHSSEGGGDVLGDDMSIVALRNMAIFNVPPHRGPRRSIFPLHPFTASHRFVVRISKIRPEEEEKEISGGAVRGQGVASRWG